MESPGFVCSPMNFLNEDQIKRLGTKKKNVVSFRLSMKGTMGVVNRANKLAR